MNVNAIAPDIKPGYPSNGKRVGPAWRELWALLAGSPDDYQDGRALAEKVADAHGLNPMTLVGVLQRAAEAGLLDRDARQVTVSVTRKVKTDDPDETLLRRREATRTRTHYRPAREHLS